MIRALIFDFDGLILDTEEPEYRAWCEVYSSHGCSLPLERWVTVIGTTDHGFDAHAELESQLGHAVDRDEVRARRRQRLSELIATQVALPGVEDYLAEARRLGLALGVASSSNRSWVAGHLGRLGLLDAFQALACGDEAPRTKPDPALYQLVLSQLRVAPHEAIALEDSPNGIAAAKSAGLFCVAVPNALTRHLPLGAADLQLSSLAALPLTDLIRRVEAAWHVRGAPLA